jgi:hypothetical protein
MNKPTSFAVINQRKILKWVFRILENHHRRLGLKAFAWAGPDGLNIHRISFFFDGVRHKDGGAPLIDWTAMSMYQSWLGVCGGIEDHPEQKRRELRTEEILPWLEGQLGVIAHYQKLSARYHFPYENTGEDPRWELRANAYLLTWNVFSRWCMRNPKPLLYYTLATFPCDHGPPDWLDPAIKTFAHIADPFDILVIMDTTSYEPALFWITTGHVISVNGMAIDLNVLARTTPDAKELAKRVEAVFPGPFRTQG